MFFFFISVCISDFSIINTYYFSDGKKWIWSQSFGLMTKPPQFSRHQSYTALDMPEAKSIWNRSMGQLQLWEDVLCNTATSHCHECFKCFTALAQVALPPRACRPSGCLPARAKLLSIYTLLLVTDAGTNPTSHIVALNHRVQQVLPWVAQNKQQS